MRLLALALLAPLACSQSWRESLVTAVRTWPTAEATRVAIEVSGPFEFKYDRLYNPYRVYFDIKGAIPRIDGKRIWSREVTDKLVTRIRVAETAPGVTRVVVDVSGPVEVTPSQLTSPNRLMIEMRAGSPAVATPPAPVAVPTEVVTGTSAPLAAAPPPPPATTPAPKPDAPSKPVEIKADLPRVEAPRTETPKRETAATTAPRKSPAKPEAAPAIEAVPVDAPAAREAVISREEPAKGAHRPSSGSSSLTRAVKPEAAPPIEAVPAEAPVAKESAISREELAKGAHRTSSGSSSLTRALGLKLNRIVLDAGHGGHDQGTSGPKGLLEKELVLDVTLRLGKLIEQGLGAEVIYTRSDDTFIPLEGRTAMANEKKADLFLSIHANSSPYPRITGVETYYLNFSDSKEAMDLAARENAASQRSIFELQDLLQKITLHEKIDESREFANRVQSSMFALSLRSFPGQKSRGVKKAPFVVLIGAQMPSILAEIGFVTNPREEQLLKRPDYRQKIAESIYKGVSKYAESLSHFQLAENH